MPSVYLIHAWDAIDYIGVRLGEGKHLLASSAYLLVGVFHVCIVSDQGSLVKV